MLFNSTPVEIRGKSVMVEVNGQIREIANDFVWVFAGGTPPTEFLKKIGVGFGMTDVTLEAAREVRAVAAAKDRDAQYTGADKQ